VSEGETEWGGASDDLASVVVLGTMAWAHVLVGGSVPGDNTTQMSAYSVNCIILEAVFLGDQIMSVTFETLHKLSISFLASGQPSLL